jgi:hypothetical protein
VADAMMETKANMKWPAQQRTVRQRNAYTPVSARFPIP